MDGQLFSSTDDDQNTQFALSLTSEEESSNMLLIIIIIVVALAVLVGVGAFFFTFEEELEDLVEENYSTEQAADPYAWAKTKSVPEIPATSQPVQQIQPVVQQQPVQQVQQVAQAASSQHPGWLWDQESNQWVPDPNYVPGQN
jgi:flagellar basal body-associated protein FliL